MKARRGRRYVSSNMTLCLQGRRCGSLRTTYAERQRNGLTRSLKKRSSVGNSSGEPVPGVRPPFPTKDFAEHRRARKRRIVVDYRRVNARSARAVYFVRNAAGVIYDCAGSIWLSFLDAVTGFNHIVSTRRAREMLAILARCGQFLPVCLTFGPQNGPEDFSYVVDRFYSPGRDAKRRFCTEWQAYVDDLTVRTGRVIDGQWFTDEEFSLRIRKAVQDQTLGHWQSVEDALGAQG